MVRADVTIGQWKGKIGMLKCYHYLINISRTKSTYFCKKMVNFIQSAAAVLLVVELLHLQFFPLVTVTEMHT